MRGKKGIKDERVLGAPSKIIRVVPLAITAGKLDQFCQFALPITITSRPHILY